MSQREGFLANVGIAPNHDDDAAVGLGVGEGLVPHHHLAAKAAHYAVHAAYGTGILLLLRRRLVATAMYVFRREDLGHLFQYRLHEFVGLFL